MKPIPLRRAVPGGFCRDDFAVDHQARTMTCPAGITVPIAPRGRASFGAKCTGCRASETAAPHRLRGLENGASIPMTTSSLRPAVNGNKESGSRSTRRWRPMVERSIAWLVAERSPAASDSAASRNRRLGLYLRAAAINLRRLVNLGLRTSGRMAAQERPDPLRASSGRQREHSLRALPTWVADFNPLACRRFGRTCP